MSDLSRRTFLSTLGAGSVVMAAGSLLAETPDIGAVMPTKGPTSDRPLPKNESSDSRHYRPPYRFGFGGVAIGNAFAPVTDEEARRTLEAAWAAGVRYFDTSPWYGLGLSERRIGQFLDDHSPDDYVLSTKIGRILEATDERKDVGIWKRPSPFSYRYDYTADGTRRSIEDSLQRLGVSRIDIVFIHDLSPDNGDMGEKWTEYFDQAAKGAMPELIKMRDEGLIKAWGFGVNRPQPALRAIEESDPDIFLLATQYSLMEHQDALENTFPKLEERGISVVVGAPLNAGYLAGRERYNYSGQIPDWAPEKRSRISTIAEKHGIDLRTAALQFAAAPAVVSAVIPGARNAAQAEADAESMRVKIPGQFWDDLKSEKLIAENAPVPRFS